jgi:hypothetical protein
MKYIDKLISKVEERKTELDVNRIPVEYLTDIAPKNNGDIIVTQLLNTQNQFRIYHWQTKSYAHHKAFGNIYELLDESIDQLLETYFGKYGRAYATTNFNITLNNLVDGSGVTLANQTIDFLMGEFTKSIKQTDTDLLNLRDGIVGDLNRLKYLLTLG